MAKRQSDALGRGMIPCHSPLLSRHPQQLQWAARVLFVWRFHSWRPETFPPTQIVPPRPPPGQGRPGLPERLRRDRALRHEVEPQRRHPQGATRYLLTSIPARRRRPSTSVLNKCYPARNATTSCSRAWASTSTPPPATRCTAPSTPATSPTRSPSLLRHGGIPIEGFQL